MNIGERIEMTRMLSGRWTIPILMNLANKGGRFTPLQQYLRISPSRLTDNLRRMEQLGLIKRLSPTERRHPLLPEYLLTEKGSHLRKAANAILQAEEQLGAGVLSAKSWSWPVLIAVYHGHHRFQSIRQTLPDTTPRILSTRLRELHEQSVVDKTVRESPRPGYEYSLPLAVSKVVAELDRALSVLADTMPG